MKKIPLSMSGDNLYSFRCDEADRHCQYAVCQHTVWAYKQGRLKGFEDCRDAIERRACPAIKMMLAEKKAGKALYFESYEALVKEREERINRMLEEAKRSQRQRKSILESSRTAENEEAIQRKEEAVMRKLEAIDNPVPKPKKTKPRKAKKDTNLNESGNMFAEIVNNLANKEAS